MLPSFATQSITRVRPSTKTSRGSTIPDWDPQKVNSKTIGGCSIQPASTSLSMDGRVLAIEDGWTAYLPEDADVQAGDHIVWDGETYEINGAPRKWTGPQRTSHIQLNLRRWEG